MVGVLSASVIGESPVIEFSCSSQPPGVGTHTGQCVDGCGSNSHSCACTVSVV